MKAGKEFEILIEKIYKELSPNADITRNDKILGKDSGITREIDLSIRSNVSGHEILIVVQAKDYKKQKADINVVGEFSSVIKDVRASKGILICNTGFTYGAVEMAKNQGIDLCSAHDASNKKWSLELKIPILLKLYTKEFGIDFRIRSNEELFKKNQAGKIDISFTVDSKDFTIDKGMTMTSISEMLYTKSNSNFKFIPSGEYSYNLLDKDLKIKIENILVDVEVLTINIRQICTYYLKYVNADEYRGIQNSIDKQFTPSFIGFKTEISAKIPDESWQKIESDQLSITPLTLVVESDSELFDGEYYEIGSSFKIKKEQK